MGQNNKIMQAQIAQSEQCVDRVRQQQARSVLGSNGNAIDGPVKL